MGNQRMNDEGSPPFSVHAVGGKERIKQIWKEIIEVVQARYNLTEAEAEQEVGSWMEKLGMRARKM